MAFRGELDQWLASMRVQNTDLPETLEQLELRLQQLQIETRIVRDKICNIRRYVPRKIHKAAA